MTDELHIIGDPNSPQAYEIRDFLNRSGVRFEWSEDSDPGTKLTCIFADRSRLNSPTVHELAERLGFIQKPKQLVYDVTIFGAGPAGLSAAVYAASEGLKTAVVEKGAVGGQAGTSSSIENYLGFPEGISGAELADRARRQAVKMGADIILVNEGVGAQTRDGLIYAKLSDGSELVSRTGVCATGISYRKLGVPNESDFYGRGVFYGAGAGEARFCKGDDEVFVVGGGNSAGQSAIYFSAFATQVTMLVRGSDLSSTLSQYLISRIQQTPNIRILFNTSIVGVAGNKNLETVTILDAKNYVRKQMRCKHLFVCIGGVPNTAWSCKKNRLVHDEGGYFVTGPDLQKFDDPSHAWTLTREPYYLETNVPGVFAIGDVRHNSIKRFASAVGEGATVTGFLLKHLAEIELQRKRLAS